MGLGFDLYCELCESLYGAGCSTCDSNECTVCSILFTLELNNDNLDCIIEFTDCDEFFGFYFNKVWEEIGRDVYYCGNCASGYAWSDEDWKCVKCDRFVRNCEQCVDNTFVCTDCAGTLIPDFEGYECRFNIAESDGLGGC